MAYLGWLIAGIILGCILGIRLQRTRLTLQQRSASVTTFRGRSIQETIALLERLPRRSEALPDGCTLYTWQESGYVLRLLFDTGQTCMGVYDERHR